MFKSKGQEVESRSQNPEDLRYYLECPLRKGHPRIAVTVCHKQKCMFLTSQDGKLGCGYGFRPGGRSSPEGDPNARK